MVADLYNAGGGGESEIAQFAMHVDSDQGIEIQRMAEMPALIVIAERFERTEFRGTGRSPRSPPVPVERPNAVTRSEARRTHPRRPALSPPSPPPSARRRTVRQGDRPAGPHRRHRGHLRLAYGKLPATGTRTGTLVLLSGGPGQAAMPILNDFAELIEPLRPTYDIVAVDQRGTGGSDRVDCKIEDADDVAACATTLGARRAYWSTPETAKDLENLRVALGVDKLTLFGVSYGTKVAQEYVRRYPAQTAAIILDSPTPVDGLDGVDQLRTFGAPRVLKEVCSPASARRP